MTTPSDPWLARRALRWGASEVATLLVALGRRPVESLPTYAQPDARITRQTHGQPRIIAVKAGLVASRKRGRPAQLGLEREERLAHAWRDLVAHGHGGPGTEGLLASTLVWVPHAIPRELLPLVDPRCAYLAATPDAMIRDAFGALVPVDTKCSVKPYGGAKWHHVCQIHVQADITSADYGLIVEGEGWSAEWRDHAGEPSGPIRTWVVERDDALMSEIREAAEEGWHRVECLRERLLEVAA